MESIRTRVEALSSADFGPGPPAWPADTTLHSEESRTWNEPDHRQHCHADAQPQRRKMIAPRTLGTTSSPR